MPADDPRRHAAEHQLATLEQRLAGLQEVGCDVGAMRARIGLARHWLAAGDFVTCERVAHEVHNEAHALAEHAHNPANDVRRRTDRRWRTPLPVAEAQDAAPEGPSAPSTDQAFSERLEERLAHFHNESLQRLDGLTAALDRRLSELPHVLDERTATRLAAVSADLRREWHEELAVAEGRLRAATSTDLAAHRDAIDRAVSALSAQVVRLEENADEANPASDDVAPLAEMVGSEVAKQVANLAMGADLQQQIERLRQELASRVDTSLGDLTKRRQDATGVVAKAVSTLPTREELQKLGEQLRADLDWKLERLAVEQGWVSLADVETVINQRVTAAPGTSAHQPPTVSFPRLEAALTEFVHQLSKQQDRFLTAMAGGPIGTSGASSTSGTIATQRPPTDAIHPSRGAMPPSSPTIAESAAPLNTAARIRTLLPVADQHLEPVISDATSAADADAGADAVSGDVLSTFDCLPQFQTAVAAQQSIPSSPRAETATIADPPTITMNLNPLAHADGYAGSVEQDVAAAALLGSVSSSAAAIFDDAVATSGALTAKVPGGSIHPAVGVHADLDVAAIAAALDRAVTAEGVSPAPGQGAEAARHHAATAAVQDQLLAGDPPLAAGGRSASMPDATDISAPQLAAQSGLSEQPTLRAAHSAMHIPAEASADVRRQLGDWLRQEPARTAILAVVATEAVANPGPLAELTGLRAFLKREIARQLAATNSAA